MDATELLKQIKKAPLTSALELDRLRLATTIGDTVLPNSSSTSTEPESYREFFDAIYADDNKKNTSVWAAWAKPVEKILDRTL